jgi:beta-glucosidase
LGHEDGIRIWSPDRKGTPRSGLQRISGRWRQSHAGAAQLPPFDINYTEGLKVGYKWFEAEGKTPLFAFGYGLSYTTFEYSGLKADAKSVTFAIKNTGKRAGAEVGQVYVALPPGTNEPPKRLVAWAKVQLEPGESKFVHLALDPLFLSIFNEAKDSWEVVPGDYRVMVGSSSQNTPLTAAVRIGM